MNIMQQRDERKCARYCILAYNGLVLILLAVLIGGFAFAEDLKGHLSNHTRQISIGLFGAVFFCHAIGFYGTLKKKPALIKAFAWIMLFDVVLTSFMLLATESPQEAAKSLIGVAIHAFVCYHCFKLAAHYKTEARLNQILKGGLMDA